MNELVATDDACTLDYRDVLRRLAWTEKWRIGECPINNIGKVVGTEFSCNGITTDIIEGWTMVSLWGQMTLRELENRPHKVGSISERFGNSLNTARESATGNAPRVGDATRVPSASFPSREVATRDAESPHCGPGAESPHPGTNSKGTQ